VLDVWWGIVIWCGSQSARYGLRSRAFCGWMRSAMQVGWTDTQGWGEYCRGQIWCRSGVSWLDGHAGLSSALPPRRMPACRGFAVGVVTRNSLLICGQESEQWRARSHTPEKRWDSFKGEFIMVLRIPKQVSDSSRALTCHPLLVCQTCRNTVGFHTPWVWQNPYVQK